MAEVKLARQHDLVDGGGNSLDLAESEGAQAVEGPFRSEAEDGGPFGNRVDVELADGADGLSASIHMEVWPQRT